MSEDNQSEEESKNINPKTSKNSINGTKPQISVFNQMWNDTCSSFGEEFQKKGPEEIGKDEYTFVQTALKKINAGEHFDSFKNIYYSEEADIMAELKSILNEQEVSFLPNCFRFWLPAGTKPADISNTRQIYMMISKVCYSQKGWGANSSMVLGRKQLELTVVVNLLNNIIKATRNNGILIKTRNLDSCPTLQLLSRHAYLSFMK